MESPADKPAFNKNAQLPPEKFAEFLALADTGVSSFKLGQAFGLRERTALNWKKRLMADREKKA